MKLTVELTKEQEAALKEHAEKKGRTLGEDLVAVWWGRTKALQTYAEGKAAAPGIKRRVRSVSKKKVQEVKEYVTGAKVVQVEQKKPTRKADPITLMDSPEVALAKAERLSEADGFKSEAEILKEAGRDHRTGNLLKKVGHG